MVHRVHLVVGPPPQTQRRKTTPRQGEAKRTAATTVAKPASVHAREGVEDDRRVVFLAMLGALLATSPTLAKKDKTTTAQSAYAVAALIPETQRQMCMSTVLKLFIYRCAPGIKL